MQGHAWTPQDTPIFFWAPPDASLPSYAGNAEPYVRSRTGRRTAQGIRLSGKQRISTNPWPIGPIRRAALVSSQGACRGTKKNGSVFGVFLAALRRFARLVRLSPRKEATKPCAAMRVGPCSTKKLRRHAAMGPLEACACFYWGSAPQPGRYGEFSCICTAEPYTGAVRSPRSAAYDSLHQPRVSHRRMVRPGKIQRGLRSW